jgi:hypothetical protein
VKVAVITDLGGFSGRQIEHVNLLDIVRTHAHPGMLPDYAQGDLPHLQANGEGRVLGRMERQPHALPNQ